MAKRPKCQVEETDEGLQYVLPGAERIPSPAVQQPPQYPADGAQLVIPGTEQISTRELTARMMERPLRSHRQQRSPAGTSLFGPRK